MKLEPTSVLAVTYAPSPERQVRVGRLAVRARQVLFEYDAAFIRSGIELSPLRLPLGPGVRVGDPAVFDGLMGLFDDSLPDGWGRLLLDRHLARSGFEPERLSPLDRLAWVGSRGMGALTYAPELGGPVPTVVELGRLSADTARVLRDVEGPDLERLLLLGGSPQGARPKALVQLAPDGRRVLYGADALEPGYTPYLVKFRARGDDPEAGLLEHVYARLGRAAGLDVPETRMLGRTARRRGYFASRRFDRDGASRRHVHTACGLLHAPHTAPSLTYRELLGVTRRLTRDEAMVTEMFRRACFNVFAHNRDDHTKNFAFLMSEAGAWRVSPAYDLTPSRGPGGEHTLLVDDEGRAPTERHLRALARSADLRGASAVIDEVRAGVARFRALADEEGLSPKVRERVAALLGLPKARSKPTRNPAATHVARRTRR